MCSEVPFKTLRILTEFPAELSLFFFFFLRNNNPAFFHFPTNKLDADFFPIL